MRRFHESIDRLYVGLVHRFVPPLFRHGSASPPLPEHLAGVTLNVPALAGDGRYKLTARTLVGDLEAGFRLRLGAQAARPVLIYHHGLGEIPHDHTFRWIFRRRTPVDAHLVAIRAPFHRFHIECSRGLASLKSFLAMCAVSVTLIEAVRLTFAARGARGCVVAGISFGGFLTLLHHVAYGTASRYAPLLAGPDFASTLLATPCRRFLAAQAVAEPTHLPLHPDFRQAFRAGDARRIFPLLARHDLWMPCAYHQPEYAASGVPVTLIDRGHMTGSGSFASLRAHLLAVLHGLAHAEAIGAAAR